MGCFIIRKRSLPDDPKPGDKSQERGGITDHTGKGAAAAVRIAAAQVLSKVV